MPPSPETDAQIQALFRTAPLTEDEKVAMSKVIDDIGKLAPRKRLKVTAKLVGRQIVSQKAAAGCGPSGWRNSHLSVVYADAAGPQALADWASAWASGSISPWLAALWTATLARPFFKTAQCESVRPILQSEALLKFAFGCCAKGCRIELEQGAGLRQYGAGKQGGAALEIAEIRAAAAMRPDCALIGLDEQNAFGAVEWADALRQAQRHAPIFAVPLSMLWRSGAGIIVHVLKPDGTWGFFTIFGGVVQGNQEGSPVFCLVIGQVLRRVVDDARLAGAKMLHWLYIDDWVVQLPLDKAIALLDAAEESSARSNLRLQRRKCAFHVPALADVPVKDWPPLARALLDRIPHQAGGLILLGTEASGDRAMPLHVRDVAPPQTKLRAERAVHLGAALLEMVNLAPAAGARQAAFSVARGLVAHALDFDMSVLPSCLVQRHAREVDVSVMRCVAATFDTRAEDLSPHQLNQLRLPTRCAGLQVDLPSLTGPLAYAAALLEQGPPLRAAIPAWRALAPHCHLPTSELDGTVAAERKGLLVELAQRGIHSGGLW